MKDQKAENLLNLALSVPEEERRQTGELDVGYDRETRTWELIVKYSGDLAGAVREQFPEAELKELSGGFGILTVPEEEVPRILELKEAVLCHKPGKGGLLSYSGAAVVGGAYGPGSSGGDPGFRH